MTVSRFGDDLDPVVECHTEDEFWQLVVTIETTPAFLRGFKQLEDHRERRPIGPATLRSDGAVAHGSEGAFNRIGNRYEILGADVRLRFRDRGVWCDHPGQRHREHEVRAGRSCTLSCELVLVDGRLCDSPGCAESADP